LTISLLKLLRNQIDITRVPFSDRGSRLLINQYVGQSRLSIKLAERLISLQPGLETYLERLPFIQDLCLVDSNGEALDFEVTTYAEMLEFQTSAGCFRLVFQDANTLTFGLPSNTTSGLRFHAQTELYQMNSQGAELKHVRNLAYATNGRITKNKISMNETGREIEFIVEAADDCVITFHISGNDNLSHPVLPFSIAHSNAEKRWQDWFDRVPPVAEKYLQKYACAWWVMGNNLISPLGHVHHEAMMPTKAFYLGVWLWDSALHAIAFRHADPELARNQLRTMLAHQLSDGMLPDAIFDEDVVSEIDHPFQGKVTKPPIMAWAALKVHETDPNVEFLREIYPALVRCIDWWFADKNSLAQYEHPYSSGLDNSPLWDYGMPVKSPDINTYLNIKMISLAKIADILGMHEEASGWRQRAESHLQCMLKDLWDEKAGLFKSLHNEQPIPVLTPFNLYPLWTGQLPQEIKQRLVEHLKNPDEFWGEYMIPTVARNDPAYSHEKMWRGPVWANINYFFVEALQKVGEIELARELRDKTLNMIMGQPGIHEYYNPETGEPPATSANMFGWTAAVFIELAIQATADSDSAIL
jgi:putative isomerase